MKNLYYCGIFAGAVLSANAQVYFTFDYTYDTSGYFSGENSYRQSTLEAAGARVSSYLTQQTLASVGGENYLYIFNPSTNFGFQEVANVSLSANEIRIYVGAYAYGGSALAYGGQGQGYSLEPSVDLSARGTDFLPASVGSMSFNSSSTSIYWDQDVSNFEDPRPGDFDHDAYTFIQHELLHVLGYGTNAAWQNLVVDRTFIGANSVELYGGDVPLSTDTSHWAASVTSTTEGGLAQTALMNPFIFGDERAEMTAIDIAGLQDIGWAAAFPSSVPEPSSYALMAGFAGLFIAVNRRRRRS